MVQFRNWNISKCDRLPWPSAIFVQYFGLCRILSYNKWLQKRVFPRN